MQTASTAFIDALRWGTTLVAARITHYQDGQPSSVVLPVSNGTFTVDRNSEFRRSGQVTVEVLPTVPPQTATDVDGTFYILPLNPQAHLSPFKNEIFVEISVVGPGGVAGANGWVPLGLYQIATSVVQDSGNDLIATLDLYDRSWALAQRQLLTAYTIPAAGGDLQSEVEALFQTAWGSTPPWSYNITPNPAYTVPAGTYNQGQDPFQAALDFFSSAGYEIYFDVNGNVVGKPVPNPATSPVVWNFSEGEVAAVGTLAHGLSGTPYTSPVDVTLQMTRDGIPNDFIVSASGTTNASGSSTPVQASAADTNPASPTYINGPMGNVPSFIFDSTITSQAQAQAEANYDLTVALAKSWTISVDTPPNPLFDIDDVCAISRAKLAMTNQPFVIDTITTSIRYDATTTIEGRVVVL